jgi:hypothetical protein
LLYQSIAKATSSEASIEEKKNVSKEMKKVTDALQKTFLGMEQLENFDKTLRLTVSEIEKATAYVKVNLSQVIKPTPSTSLLKLHSRSRVGD